MSGNKATIITRKVTEAVTETNYLRVDEPVEVKPEIVIVEPETVPQGITLASVPIGQNFRYNEKVYKKINNGVVLNFLNADDATESMNNNTIIEPIIPSHFTEPDA